MEDLTLDPFEFLLETSRQNNLSSTPIRWRPLYDWSKERETLVTVVARLGGNAIDGNIIGVGARVKLDSENQLSLLPIVGQNSNDVLFEATYSRSRFFSPRLTQELIASRLGGKRTFTSGVRYSHLTSENFVLDTTYAFSFEEVEAASVGGSAEDPVQQPGTTNNFNINFIGSFYPRNPFAGDLAVELEHSQPALNSEFHYTTVFATYGQDLGLHINHALRFELIRGLTDGEAPVQKQHLLGDPLVLRGFPRTINLVSDNIAALRMEYHFVLTRHIYGSSVQTRKLKLILFADVGKGWDNDEEFGAATTRKDVGLGVNIDLSVLNTLEFPLRIEVAFPQGDPDFKDRQIIFLQALSFF